MRPTNTTRPRRGPSPLALETLAADLKGIWSAPTTDARLKKRIVRTLIHEAVADLDEEQAEIVLILHWVGGAHWTCPLGVEGWDQNVMRL